MTDQRDYREPLTDEEAEQAERGLRRLLHMPPKPHGKNPSAPPKRKADGPEIITLDFIFRSDEGRRRVTITKISPIPYTGKYWLH